MVIENRLRSFLALLSITLLTMISNKASAQLLSHIHKDLSASIIIDTNTNYTPRSIVFNDDPVFQPDVSISFKGFTIGMWQNVCLTETKEEGGVGTAPATNKIEYYTGYNYSYKIVSASVFWWYYTYPHTHYPDTQEVSFTLKLNTVLNPSVTTYWDVSDNAGGLYWKFLLNQDIPILWGLIFTPNLRLGLSNPKHSAYYAEADMDSTHIMDLNFGLNLGLPLGDFMEKIGGKINVHLNYTFFPNADLRHQLSKNLHPPLNSEDSFYMGLGLAFRL